MSVGVVSSGLLHACAPRPRGKGCFAGPRPRGAGRMRMYKMVVTPSKSLVPYVNDCFSILSLVVGLFVGFLVAKAVFDAWR